ncbi:MAG TPA: DinB family protein [Candidatus Eisenbacteria bacterium]
MTDPEPAVPAPQRNMLEEFLDSWDKNNIIVLNLLKALPPGALGIKPMDGSLTLGQHFSHLHSVRLDLVKENAPDVVTDATADEWADERDPARHTAQLEESSRVVREAVASRVASGRAMNLHYDSPLLLIQHLLWHEAYHYGQIKLALKLAGQALPDKEMGRVSWGVWMRRTKQP